jgi:hypothetical protein
MRRCTGFEQTPVALQCVDQVVDVALRMLRVQLDPDPRPSLSSDQRFRRVP